jgi:5-methyltetrahydrofolate--homocysteine methyltransferase
MEAIRRIKAELGVNMTMGASNVSFGLPDRELLNNAFVVMATVAGATCLIVDAAKVRSIILAADLVLGRDKRARRYIEAYRQRQKQQEQ